jgi:hypothetical protein
VSKLQLAREEPQPKFNVTIIRKNFGFNQRECDKQSICGLGRLDLHHIILLRIDTFYIRINKSDYKFQSDVIWIVFGEHAGHNESLFSVCRKRYEAMNSVSVGFHNIVGL